MEPSPALFEKYVSTMDSMHKRGMISEDDHALLRASGVAQSDLMNLTLGDDEALTEKSISKILEDTKAALVADLTAIHKEKEAASDLKRELALATLNTERERRQADRAHIQRIARGVARTVFLAPFAGLSALLLMGAFMSSGLVTLDNLAISDNAKVALRAVVVLAVIAGWWSLLTGTSVRAMLLRREEGLAAFIRQRLMPD